MLHDFWMTFYYVGDIRFPFAEDKEKLTKILHSQTLPLSDIYLSLLSQTPGFLHPSLQQPTNFEAFVSSTAPKDSATQSGVTVKPVDFPYKQPTGSGRAFQSSSILAMSQMPLALGLGGELSADILAVLSKYHRSLAANARDRLTETGTGVNPDRIDPISADMRDLKAQLLSETFVFEVGRTDRNIIWWGMEL